MALAGACMRQNARPSHCIPQGGCPLDLGPHLRPSVEAWCGLRSTLEHPKRSHPTLGTAASSLWPSPRPSLCSPGPPRRRAEWSHNSPESCTALRTWHVEGWRTTTREGPPSRSPKLCGVFESLGKWPHTFSFDIFCNGVEVVVSTRPTLSLVRLSSL